MSASKGPRARLEVRFPRYLHGRLLAAARAQGLNLNDYMTRELLDAVRRADYSAYEVGGTQTMSVVCREDGLYEVVSKRGEVLAGGFTTEALAWYWVDQHL